MYKNCVFDLYGTLIDINTDEWSIELWEKMAVYYGYKGAIYTAEELNEEYGKLVEAEKKYGVNAFFMAGIVALESGFATSRRAIEDNNLTGYEVYSDSSEGRLFNSHDESVLHTARHLSKNYLKEDSMYYNGLSVDAIQIMYCPDEEEDKRWEEKVDYLASNFLKTYDNLFRVDKS